MSSVAIETLGCKLNHYESLGIEAALRRRGFVSGKLKDAEVVIVNSCAVTAEAVRQSFQVVRRARRRNPAARVFLAGCAVMAEPDRCLELDGVEACFGNRGKAELAEWVGKPAEASKHPVLVQLSGELPIGTLRADIERGRQRVELKVQDGCNSFCRYCIIPYLRGRCRSLPQEEVLGECRKLAAAGFREIVLTGIHLGRYGDDLGAGESLTGLLRKLVERFPQLRFRLGSLQPHEITPEIIELLQTPDNPVCEHLHLSLQAGSDRVLSAMGRPYRKAAIESLFRRLAQGGESIRLGADFIVGFPAEDEAAFHETLELVADSGLSYLHVFPYSPRVGTVAASWPDRVPGTLKKARAGRLTELGEKKRKLFCDGQVGKRLSVLLEKRLENEMEDGAWIGHSRNYLPVLVPDDGKIGAGEVVTVEAVSWDGRRILSRLLLS
ncbi:MAG: tRNA (N(6)-L-threonylcarbamoyladenosine(37)-C(2))-methylthiotransferase MtaB [Deltaproteobacteria bacterium]|nr:tRNA (N(6)-L-threonylcarbamoyladenosine(37)-C(2))-methylthiotransferase MtaB [Deltaproteobacteria bacterium]